MKRLFVFLVYLAVLFSFLAVHTAAEDTMPPDYDNFLGAIPEDVAELLPDGFSGSSFVNLE